MAKKQAADGNVSIDSEYLSRMAELGIESFDPLDDEDDSEPTNAVIYGEPGTGKTFLGLTAPDPLIIDFEQGSKLTARAAREVLGEAYSPITRIVKINYEPNVEGSAMRAMDQLRATFTFLRSGNHPFRSVVIDPFSELQKIIMADILERYPNNKRQRGMPLIDDWGTAGDTAVKLISQFRSLNMHTIFLAHTERRDNEEAEIFPLVTGKKVGPYLEGAMSLLGYLYLHRDVAEDGTAGEVQRVLQVGGHELIRAKNRGGLLPDLVADPNLTQIFAAMEGKL